MLECLMCWDSFGWISLEHNTEQIHCILINMLVYFWIQIELHFLVSFVDFIISTSFKKWLLCKEYVKHNSSRKHITLWLNVSILSKMYDLWSYISWCATAVKEIFFNICECSQSVINNYWCHWISSPNHDVFRFKVSMHYPLAMKTS